MLQVLCALTGDVLTPVINVGLHHDAGDVPLARRKLCTDRVNHERLVFVIFLRVAI